MRHARAVVPRMVPRVTMAITTLSSVARFEEVIKKSRFIAVAGPVATASAANDFVKEASDAKARHNCFAWRLADGSTRTNGDGEPGGTAGPPILSAIENAGLHDVAVLVSRYRLGEGAKLGTGGLVRAYGGSAAQCLAGATLELQEPRVTATVRYAPQDTGPVFSVLAAYSPAAAGSGASGSGWLEATFEAKPEELERVAEALRSATQGRVGCRLQGSPAPADEAGGPAAPGPADTSEFFD